MKTDEKATVINRMKNNLFVDEFSFSTYINNLEIKIVSDADEIKQAKQLLIEDYRIKQAQSQRKTSELFELRKTLIYDDYDNYAKHLIIKDFMQEKVIAYVRIIDTHTAYSLGAYYSEAQFNLSQIRNQIFSAIELSHIVIAPEFDNPTTLEALWGSLMLYADQNNADAIIGTFALSIHNKHYAAIREIKQIKSNHLSHDTHRVKPLQILPPSRARASNHFELPPVVDYFFKQGAKLCGDAAWNTTYKQAEIFFCIHPQSKVCVANGFAQNEDIAPKLVA